MDSEQRVESMIADGLRVMQEIIATIKPAQIVAAYSSGDDSMVSTHFCMTHFPDAFVFNADTMVGLKPSGDIPVAFDPKNPPNPEVDDCWLVYRMDDGGGHVYDSEPVAREAMRRHRHDGRPAFLFRSVRPKEQ